MEELLQRFFIDPIVQRSGYNAVNTLAYAAIALASLYAIWRYFRAKKFDFSSREFLLGLAAFVLLGSTSRVLTDLSDSGLMQTVHPGIAATGVFDYGYLTVTPGIYIVTAALFLLSIAFGRFAGMPMFPFYAGIALWIPCALLLLPFLSHLWFGALALLLAALGAGVALLLLGKTNKTATLHEILAVAGQALDGAATYVVIDVFSKEGSQGYFEQHVLSAGIGTATPLGFFLFFLVKLALAALIVHFLRKEKIDCSDRALVLLVVAVMGFAPGIRDILRMVAGT